MQKVLSFDRSQIGQETFFWCGPATVQNALKVQGISVSEREIARQTEELEGNRGWDDQDGTDYIGQLATVLNRYVGAGVYVVRDLPRYPDAAGIQRIWDEIRTAIDGGYALPANWEAPPSNYPRGQLGSSSPNYGGGTVYHYVLVDGYAIVDGVLYVHIADSGFQPSGYWITLTQFILLTVPKGYLALAREPELDADSIIRFIRGFVEPIASDVGDIKYQFLTPWADLGGQDVLEAVGELVGR